MTIKERLIRVALYTICYTSALAFIAVLILGYEFAWLAPDYMELLK